MESYTEKEESSFDPPAVNLNAALLLVYFSPLYSLAH